MDILTDFKEYLESEQKSKRTVATYTHCLKKMLEFFNNDIANINEVSIQKYKRFLIFKRKYRKDTIYIHLKALQKFFKYKKRNDLLPYLKTPKRPKRNPKYLTEKEAGELLEAARKNDYRDYLILRLLVYSGLRVSELCNLKINDIEFDNRIIHVLSGKGDKDRIIVVDKKQ